MVKKAKVVTILDYEVKEMFLGKNGKDKRGAGEEDQCRVSPSIPDHKAQADPLARPQRHPRARPSSGVWWVSQDVG